MCKKLIEEIERRNCKFICLLHANLKTFPFISGGDTSTE